MLCLSLVSCGKKLSGTYSAIVLGSGAEYEFKGSKVEITVKAVGIVVAEVEGKYSIDDDKITFEFEDEDAEDFAGTETFKELENGNIEIGGVEYKLIEE
jgi:hypothetical protein